MIELTKDIWSIIEWLCVLLGIFGTIWASSFKGYKIYMPFTLWIISGVIGLFLHIFYTQQYGLLLIATISLILSFIGLSRSLKQGAGIEEKGKIKSDNIENTRTPLISYFALLCTFIGICFFIYFVINDLSNSEWLKSRSFEISATLLNIAGISFISSVSKYSKWSWFVWLISNIMFTLITYNAGFMGLALQQSIFSILSLWGIINWFFLKK